ncbi:MAG: hypothetical protein IKB01_12440 [Lachnospiraceae bacterium]|nr:hypothetical protein [Lachnospiraceae bacterium]
MTDKTYPWNLLTEIQPSDVDMIRANFSDDLRAGLNHAVSLIGVKEREVIRLRYMEGKSYEEIQEVLQCDEKIVLSLERRAIDRLREPNVYNYIKYGISGYVQKILIEEYTKGFESGYVKGYEDAEADARNGFTRTERDISIMSLPLEVLQLDVRPYNCLYYNGCRTVGDCIRMNEYDIKRMRNLGKKSADAIAWALRRMDIRNTEWDQFLIEDE